MAEPPRSVECGVCLRGEKICHFRSRGLFQRKRVRTNERPLRSTLPASSPPPLFHPHTHSRTRPAACHIWRRFHTNTRNFDFLFFFFYSCAFFTHETLVAFSKKSALQHPNANVSLLFIVSRDPSSPSSQLFFLLFFSFKTSFGLNREPRFFWRGESHTSRALRA